ncbi:MAG: DNA alkylation repair protein, partial [Myxococcota bacterium]
MSSFARAVLRTATRELKARADPAKAGPMADYMKTADPFYGVQKPLRKEVFKILVQDHPIETFDQYESTVRLL